MSDSDFSTEAELIAARVKAAAEVNFLAVADFLAMPDFLNVAPDTSSPAPSDL